jgi:transposase
VLCEGEGKPITVTVTPGQEHETTQAAPLLDQVCIRGKGGRPRRHFERVAGDKGYDSRAVRQDLRRRGSAPVIPHRKLANGKYPPSARGFDKETYRRRNVIERLIGRLKEYRRIATRYDKLADSFRCFILLGFIRMWLRDLLSYRA